MRPTALCCVRPRTWLRGIRSGPGDPSGLLMKVCFVVTGTVLGSRGHSSAGRALVLHTRGQGFDSPWLHCGKQQNRCRDGDLRTGVPVLCVRTPDGSAPVAGGRFLSARGCPRELAHPRMSDLGGSRPPSPASGLPCRSPSAPGASDGLLDGTPEFRAGPGVHGPSRARAGPTADRARRTRPWRCCVGPLERAMAPPCPVRDRSRRRRQPRCGVLFCSPLWFLGGRTA